jgi:hypothetical protein
MLLLPLDFGLGLWRLHIMAAQVERPWEFIAESLDFGLGLWRLNNMVVHVESPWEFMAKSLDFGLGGLTLCPTEGSNSYILLAIFSPFIWTFNKVWPFNPMASRLGRP